MSNDLAGKKPSKRLSKKRVFTYRVLPILRHIKSGEYPAKIARMLGISKQLCHYYIKKLERSGFIRREVRSSCVFYSLTERVKDVLDRFEQGLGLADREIRLHNVVFKFSILKKPRLPIDWPKVVAMRNWNQLIGTERQLTVRKNPDSLEVFPDVVYGTDAYELFAIARDEAMRLARYLESKFQMKLSETPTVSRRPHFGVYDRIADMLPYQFSDDVAKIDRSEGAGEIDFYDPEDVKNYLLSTSRIIPNKLDKLINTVEDLTRAGMNAEQRLQRIEEIIVLLFKNLEAKGFGSRKSSHSDVARHASGGRVGETTPDGGGCMDC